MALESEERPSDVSAILRSAVLEAQEAVAEEVRKLFLALREEIPANFDKALIPVLDLLQEIRRDSRMGAVRSSASLGGRDNRSPQEMKEHRSLEVSDVPRILRRVSAPLNAARAAVSANRAAMRLKRSFISPENSEEIDETPQGPAPARRVRPALSREGIRPLQTQLQEATTNRIPTILRVDDADGEAASAPSVREDPADLAAALFPDERRLSGPPGQVEEVTSPALPSPALPQGLPSPQADFRHGTSSQTSSMNDSEDAPSERSVHSTVRTDRRRQNSLEILPNYLNVQDLSREPLPLYRRVADALAKPFRCWRAPPGRSPHPARKTVTKVRPSLRTGGSTNLEAKMAIKAQGRLARRTAVVLQASEMEKLKSKAWWRCGRKADWPFADPSGRPRQCWDMVASALLCLQLLYLPFQAAFVSNTDFQDPAFFTINVCLLAMDIFWTADLLLNFTTGYRDAVQVLHCDFRSTSAHYLRSWFPVDLLATVPALLLHLLVLDGQIRRDESHLWPLRWLGFSPFLRTPRLWRAFHMLRRLEANLKSSLVSSVVALVQLVMLPIIFSHISACALWYLGRSNLESDATTSSWIKLGLDISDAPGALQAVSVGERYMTAMYFAITVMSTVGLGDINMNLSNERALLCVIMATTSLVVGVAVNGVATIVSKLSERTAVTNEQLAKVSRFLRVYSVPGDLQSRVHNYLLQFFENQEREETKSMLMKWLKKSEVLRVNVNMALTGTCLATHHLLQLVPADILVDICDICDMEFHPPGQELILEGAEVKSCFYIRRGLVQTRRNIGKVDSSKLSRAMTTKSLAFAGGPGEEMEDIDEIQKEVEAVEAARPDAQLHGGSFLGDVRLFLGASRSWKTVTCSSFCELISIDVEKFRSLMVSHLPELFDVLVIYSAIDNHCPKALQRCLEEQCLSPEVPLLFGEGLLHHCAKKNAESCADFLIEQLGADVSVLDQEEKTPAQVAAKLKHKEVFWAVIKHGSIVTDQDVLPKEAQSIRNRTKRGVQVLSSGSLEAEGDEKNWTPSELRERLQQSGLNLGLYGHEGHKSLEDLVAELHTCQSELVTGPGKRIHRRVKLVRLQLLAIIDNSVRALVEVQSDAWLRAAHQKLGKLPCRRIRQDETVEEAMKALMLDLGMPEHLLEEKLVVPVANCIRVESKVSMGFPGLESEYIVHESSWKIRAAALAKAAQIGLPQGNAFSVESPGAQGPNRRLFWPVLLNIHLDAKQEMARTEDLRVRFENSHRRTDSSTALARLNPLRAFGAGRVVEVGMRQT